MFLRPWPRGWPVKVDGLLFRTGELTKKPVNFTIVIILPCNLKQSTRTTQNEASIKTINFPFWEDRAV